MYTIEGELNIDAGKHVLNYDLFWMNKKVKSSKVKSTFT